MLKIDLLLPSGDKNWGISFSDDIQHFPDDFREKILSIFPQIKEAKPFLQYDCLGYIFVEFWTDDEEKILNAAFQFSQLSY